ncbi:hypothetical protein BKA70DRAFT_1117393, partial [Coprinopsis sp. MPI-PUGE-AT-0042]
MKANVISYEVPVPRVYHKLPPPREDLDEVLAILFTGPSPPTQETLKRTPFLVRRDYIHRALKWLVLNHSDYADVEISLENIQSYPEDAPPVYFEYIPMTSNKSALDTSVFDQEEEDGTAEGPCTFAVHGITGDKLTTMSPNAIRAKAMRHVAQGGRFLVIGHESEPASFWNNPQLYPQMFPH